MRKSVREKKNVSYGLKTVGGCTTWGCETILQDWSADWEKTELLELSAIFLEACLRHRAHGK